MTVPIILAGIDMPQGALGSVAVPVSAIPNRIPARFMLPVIIAAAQGKAILCPDDLIANFKTAGLDGLLDCRGMSAGMPHICQVALEQGVGFTPVDAIIIPDLTQLGVVVIHPSLDTPFGGVAHTTAYPYSV